MMPGQAKVTTPAAIPTMPSITCAHRWRTSFEPNAWTMANTPSTSA